MELAHILWAAITLCLMASAFLFGRLIEGRETLRIIEAQTEWLRGMSEDWQDFFNEVAEVVADEAKENEV